MIASTRVTARPLPARGVAPRIARSGARSSQRVFTQVPPKHGPVVTESWVEEVCELKGEDGEGKDLAMACSEALTELYTEEHEHPQKSSKDNVTHHMNVAHEHDEKTPSNPQ